MGWGFACGMSAAGADFNAFALDIFGKLRNRDGNLFYSPYSIYIVLKMTYSGARGKTASEMRDVLYLKDGGDEKDFDFRDSHFNIANAIWVQKNFRIQKKFSESLRKNYDAKLNTVDFIRSTEKARKIINKWVERKTNKKIVDLIPPGGVTTLSRLVLTNAIYFYGNWANRFDKKQTEKAYFTLQNDKKIKIDMMYQKNDFKYYQVENPPPGGKFGGGPSAQIIELPYVGGNLSMVVILPEYGGLIELEESFTLKNLNEWMSKLRNRKVEVYLPKFKMESKFLLSSILKSLGMVDAFLPSESDFSGITKEKDLFISEAFHKAFVDVDEKGTEAAAATGVIMGITSIPPSFVVFRADRPFLFLIRESSRGVILFLGRLTNPA